MKKRRENKFIFCIIIGFILMFALGWLNPIEGPLDFLYDEYATQPAHIQPTKKYPSRIAPLPTPVKEIYIDLNEDEEPEWCWIIPKPEEIEGE